MAHPRTEIRKALASMLDGKTVAQSEVHTNRTRRFRPSDLPAIVLYDAGETAQLYNESPREYRRQATIAIDLYVEDKNPDSGPPIDEVLDDFADEVEKALFADTSVDGHADDLRLQETSDVMVSDDQREQLAMVTITWQATYYQEAPEVDPDTLADYTDSDVDWHIDDDDDEEASDEIALPQD